MLISRVRSCFRSSSPTKNLYPSSCGCPVTRSLDTKGVNFGEITVDCGGTVDYSAVEGVNTPSLRIKPFFAQGGTISMREFLIGAFKAEMGLEAFDPILCAVTDPVSSGVVYLGAGKRDHIFSACYDNASICEGLKHGAPTRVDHARHLGPRIRFRVVDLN